MDCSKPSPKSWQVGRSNGCVYLITRSTLENAARQKDRSRSNSKSFRRMHADIPGPISHWKICPDCDSRVSSVALVPGGQIRSTRHVDCTYRWYAQHRWNSKK